eukprot:2753420-Rhodomonas_salina.1
MFSVHFVPGILLFGMWGQERERGRERAGRGGHTLSYSPMCSYNTPGSTAACVSTRLGVASA